MSDIFGSNVSNADLCHGKQSQITEILVFKWNRILVSSFALRVHVLIF